jgi:nicotinamidase-related amidase/DNA-binding transcriptional MerR regulator
MFNKVRVLSWIPLTFFLHFILGNKPPILPIKSRIIVLRFCIKYEDRSMYFMQYTINKVASLAGVTTKALRHYEKVGLLIPATRSQSGYRLYSDKDIETLQQILFFRELGFPLQQIIAILKDPSFDLVKALEFQLDIMERSANKYARLAELIYKTLENSTGQTKMESSEYFKGLGNEHMAVLVCNMQNDHVTGSLCCNRASSIIPTGSLCCNRASSIIPNIQNLLATARKTKGGKRVYIIYICDSHIKGIDDTELSIWGDHAIAGTKGVEIIDELKPQQEDFVIYKKHYSSFFQTNLRVILNKLNVGTLIITGIHLNLCILQTVEDAYNWGYRIILPNDCASAFTQEDYHFGLKQIKKAYNAEIMNSKKVSELF